MSNSIGGSLYSRCPLLNTGGNALHQWCRIHRFYTWQAIPTFIFFKTLTCVISIADSIAHLWSSLEKLVEYLRQKELVFSKQPVTRQYIDRTKN